MCPVSSGFPFKGDQQSYCWLELSPLHHQVQICLLVLAMAIPHQRLAFDPTGMTLEGMASLT